MGRRSLPVYAAAALIAALAASPAIAEDVRFFGYAFDLKTDRYLYTELHKQQRENGRAVTATITYFDAEGKQIGHKTLDYRKDPHIPLFRFEIPGENYVEEIYGNAGPIEMRRVSEGKTEQKNVARTPPMAADSGFHHLLQDFFEPLLAGQKVKFKLAVAGRLDAFSFRARRIDDTAFEEKPAVQFLIEPDSLLRLLVDPLRLTYEKDTRRLLEYRGVSNVHDPATGKAYDARIAYYSQPPQGVKLPAE